MRGNAFLVGRDETLSLGSFGIGSRGLKCQDLSPLASGRGLREPSVQSWRMGREEDRTRTPLCGTSIVTLGLRKKPVSYGSGPGQ